MSLVNIIRTGKLSDKQVVELFDAISNKFGASSGSIHIGSASLNYCTNEHEGIFKNELVRAIIQADLVTENIKFTVQFRRGVGGNQTSIDHEREPNPYFDDIGIVANANANNQRKIPSPKEVVEMIEIVQGLVTNVIPKNVSSDADDATGLLQAEISSLSSLYKKMVAGIDRQRMQIDTDYAEKTRKFEEEISGERSEFRKEKVNETQKLTEEATALEARKKELDDRDHMHVRRGLREKINDEIKERLKKNIVPRTASGKSAAIITLTLIGSLGLGLIAYESIEAFSSLSYRIIPTTGGEGAVENAKLVATGSTVSPAKWTMLVRGVLASFGSIGFLVFAIRWLQKLYVEDVQTTKDLERYAHDINRASWAIETIMELNKQKDSEPPVAWIEGVCRNLFQSDIKEHSSLSPLEAFGTVLGASTRAKIGPDGPELEINRRGLKALSKGPNEA